jgi:hypothetical protein
MTIPKKTAEEWARFLNLPETYCTETQDDREAIADVLLSLSKENAELKSAIGTPEVYAEVITRVLEEEKDKWLCAYIDSETDIKRLSRQVEVENRHCDAAVGFVDEWDDAVATYDLPDDLNHLFNHMRKARDAYETELGEVVKMESALQEPKT